MKSEKEHLESLALTADYGSGLNATMAAEFIHTSAPWFFGDSVLELGPAEGFGTAALMRYFKEIDCVEGSSTLAKMLRDKFPKVTVYTDLFEEFIPSKRYDTIVMGHVLEHVDDPEQLLRRSLQWIEERGRIVIGVPNANSLHRQIGAIMGLIEHQKDLDSGDIKIGHKRVFDIPDLTALISRAGGFLYHLGGFWLKPLSNKQLQAILDPELVNSFMFLGKKYPELSAEIVAVVGRK